MRHCHRSIGHQSRPEASYVRKAALANRCVAGCVPRGAMDVGAARDYDCRLTPCTASSVRQSLSIRSQNTGEGQRFRASHW